MFLSAHFIAVIVVCAIAVATSREDGGIHAVLFVVHDAGESLALQPVIDVLLKNNSLNTSILCLGEPATSIYSNYSNSFVLSDVGITTEVVEPTEGREQVLDSEDMTTLTAAVHADVVMCGMVYSMQAQISSVS